VTILAAVIDPDGPRIELVAERWGHIRSRHPELAEEREAILQAVAHPTKRLDGPDAPREGWYYLVGAGPSGWLKVVVIFEGDVGRVITAFPRRSLP
jgi:hypothetical protein